MSNEKLPNVRYALSAKDFQEILTYISKRPLGETINVFRALERSEILPVVDAAPTEAQPVEVPEKATESAS